MKKLLSVAVLTFSLSSIANEIVCLGQNTKASVTLCLSSLFNENPSDYSFGGKRISVFGYEFGITGNQEEKTKTLTTKFKTLKKHKLAKKNSNLVLTIKQKAEDTSVFSFNLDETHDAELKFENGALIDKMICK